MIVTREIVGQIMAWALDRTAASLEIKSDDYPYTVDDLLDLISLSPAHLDTLYQFARAYLDWWNFHLSIEQRDKQGNLSAEDTTSLIRLTDAREKAKAALLAITPLPDRSH